ncbi:3353_t:CDS:2 [Scutellospora calospora]|uniref:3353_t:CDS:1 n=1 Tax=Scutellospora calospora TaxID=85575 RepID=A0ACA9JUE8_9GLOM|nr:3353_t:CDS:2 [Scutellospora calospora]
MQAIGEYPVECEDYEIEMILFALANLNERDPESQTFLKKIISILLEIKVSTSTYLTILNKVVVSNKCLLKISLVGVPQSMPQEVLNDENAIIQILINDYNGEKCNFIMKIIFPYRNSRLAYLKNTIRPHESLIFVVGQIAKEKEESFTSNSNDAHNKPELNSSDNLPLQKRVQIEDVKDEQSDHKSYADETNTLIDFEQEEGEPSNSYQENSLQGCKGFMATLVVQGLVVWLHDCSSSARTYVVFGSTAANSSTRTII